AALQIGRGVFREGSPSLALPQAWFNMDYCSFTDWEGSFQRGITLSGSPPGMVQHGLLQLYRLGGGFSEKRVHLWLCHRHGSTWTIAALQIGRGVFREGDPSLALPQAWFNMDYCSFTDWEGSFQRGITLSGSPPGMVQHGLLQLYRLGGEFS